jgi:hypothetical protein
VAFGPSGFDARPRHFEDKRVRGSRQLLRIGGIGPIVTKPGDIAIPIIRSQRVESRCECLWVSS